MGLTYTHMKWAHLYTTWSGFMGWETRTPLNVPSDRHPWQKVCDYLKWQVLNRSVHVKTSGSPWLLNGSDEQLQVIQYLRMDEDLFVQSHAQKNDVASFINPGFFRTVFFFHQFPIVDFSSVFFPWAFNTIHPLLFTVVLTCGGLIASPFKRRWKFDGAG